MNNPTDTNQASEDELKKRIGNLHAYNFDGDDVTVKVMVDEDILESIAKFVEAFIRTEKLKLIEQMKERHWSMDFGPITETYLDDKANGLKEEAEL